MNELTLLNEQEVLGKQFKVYGTADEPMFLAKDVAEWIDYSKREDGSYQVGQMIKSIDEDEKISTVNNLNGKQMWFLTEDGLYEVLMQSRKPIAKQFKKKVKEILKRLRKTGGYISNTDMFIDTYFNDMPEEQRSVIRGLLSGIEEKQKKIKNLQSENDLLSQKVLTWADRPLINALIRAYAHSLNDDYSTAWRDFKKELLYQHSINLNSRITNYLNETGKKTKPKTLEMLDESELQAALSTAVALCHNNGVDISDLVGEKAS